MLFKGSLRGNEALRLKDSRNKDFKTDKDQDRAAEDSRFSRQSRARLLADSDARKADEEGDGANEQTGKQCLHTIVIGDGKAYRQRVDRGGNALDQQGANTCRGLVLLGILAFDALVKHFAADKAQQGESDPRNTLFKCAEDLGNGGYADPADHGHGKLKQRENTRHAAHFAFFHFGFVHTVGERGGEGVHGKTDAEHDACKKE